MKLMRVEIKMTHFVGRSGHLLELNNRLGKIIRIQLLRHRDNRVYRTPTDYNCKQRFVSMSTGSSLITKS